MAVSIHKGKSCALARNATQQYNSGINSEMDINNDKKLHIWKEKYFDALEVAPKSFV